MDRRYVEPRMPLHLLLILAIVAQQLALPVAARHDQGGCCAEASCCVLVETTTCCGEVVRELCCGKTGGRCVCHLQSRDSEPKPQAPRPHEGSGAAHFAILGESMIEIPRSIPAEALHRPLPPAIARTHNEVRALLCIRTT